MCALSKEGMKESFVFSKTRCDRVFEKTKKLFVCAQATHLVQNMNIYQICYRCVIRYLKECL